MKKRKELSTANNVRTIVEKREWLLEIRVPEDRLGHGSFDVVGAFDFNNAILDLTEFKSIGGIYTWMNGSGPLHTKSKIDRALGNDNWISRWSNVNPILNYGYTSDHAILLIELVELEKECKPFRFYTSWLSIESFNDMFLSSWETIIMGSPL